MLGKKMKITELKCTACNGTLKIDENNPKIAVCEYCKTRYVIEQDDGDNVHISEETKEKPEQMWYTPQEQYASKKTSGNGWESYGWKRILAVSFLGIVMVVLMSWRGVKNRWDADHSNPTSPVMASAAGNTAGAEEPDAAAEDIPLTGVLADMTSSVFGKMSEDVTEAELSSIRRIEIKYSIDFLRVGYSTESTYDGGTEDLIWIDFPRDSASVNWDEIRCFKGLKSVSVANYLTKDAVEGLDLESMSCYAKSPEQLAEILSGQTSLKEVAINGGLESLDGIGRFKDLERLTIDGGHLTDIKELVQLTGLQSLTLENCDDITDFSVLSVMPWLTELSVESEGLKDLGFTASMPNLKSLSVEHAKILNTDSLKSVQGLTSLKLIRCGELKDVSAVEALTGLTNLDLEVPYGCAQPDLSGLTGLTTLSISGMESISFLRSLTGLEDLTVKSCQINDSSAFSGLTSLKSLKCSHVYGNITDWGFTAAIPGLERLDLSGVSTYEDISAIFHIPTLSELVISGMECEINFSKLAPNEALQILSMDGLKLYTNVQVSGGGGITYVDYDPVSLDENTSFLNNYPNLRELSIADNKLTNVAFATGLPALTSLNISGNYVTDLKPLEALTALKTVNCKENPVENYRVLSDSVFIIK